MQDRRKELRRRTFLGGSVIFNHRQSSVDCVVRNMGEQGAKLVFAHTAFVPDDFDLLVARMERSFRARVRWRGGCEIGISFGAGESGANVVPLGSAIRIRRLEGENASLRRRVAELTTGG